MSEENKSKKQIWIEVDKNGNIKPLFENYISKDKIRDKIKEYQDKLCMDIKEEKIAEYENIIEVLKELLEE